MVFLILLWDYLMIVLMNMFVFEMFLIVIVMVVDNIIVNYIIMDISKYNLR